MPTASPVAAARRSTELGLVIMAAVITAAAYTLASMGKNAQIPQRIVVFLVALLAILVLAHLANRVLAKGSDGTLLPIAALLNGVGYVMIARLSDRLAGLQTTWTFVAVAAYVGTLLVVQRASDLARYKWSFLLIGAFLLLLPLVPGIGASTGGAKIWVSIGPISFQPGEFAKIALALFFAGYLAEKRELIAASTWRIGPIRLPEPKYLLPILLAWGFAVVVMVAEKDLGSSLMFFTLFVVVMWIATERGSYLILGLLMFSGAAYVAWRIFDHVQLRVNVWLDPWTRYQANGGKGYQPVQAWFALANGGTSGTGLGLGSPNKIPAAQNDFIFAAIGEELGLIGATAVLIGFILIIGAGLRVAIRAERTFDKLLAVGLTTILGVQAFIIIAGVIRVLPLTGVTLPFISYGGSSLVANYVLLALLIRISDGTARRLGETPDELTLGERWRAWRLRRADKRAIRRGDPTTASPLVGR
ncbi:MAG TPA: FtsW/RodA/SpoVE family cell cycle protein [Ilumatobacteraceae bacterium]|nr:FtsW/RodA/SpoVE family cell cycle protein [Ilumatobacteraceae bacterium]